MKTNIHQKFIETPISNILKEAVTACKTIGDGIETHTLAEYIFQTTFLQMTGASEQKLKCICWEMATYDYEFRRDFLKELQSELSHYDDKAKVFKHIQKVIKRLTPNWKITEITKQRTELLRNCKKYIKSILKTSQLIKWHPNHYYKFLQKIKTYKPTLFANKEQDKEILTFLENSLKELYDTHTYRHRNRCAHNTRSYQQHLPTLATLSDKEYIGDNYFLMYFVLILIDELFMVLYQEFLKALDNTAL